MFFSSEVDNHTKYASLCFKKISEGKIESKNVMYTNYFLIFMSLNILKTVTPGQ